MNVALLSKRSVLGAMGLAAVLVSGFASGQAGASELRFLDALNSVEATGAAIAQAVQHAPIADGRYLYGEAPQPDQLGKGYMVFEANNGRVVGALYAPSSSFDCFQGQLEGNQLAMTITNSYTQETYPYSVALSSDGVVASTSGGAMPLQLDGFYQLNGPSENDLRMLNVCMGGSESSL